MKPYKAHRRMKSILPLLLVMVFLFCLSSVSAADWDNKISYGNENKSALFENWFGLGRDLARGELITPQDNVLFPGKARRVMIFAIENFGDNYKNALKGLEIKNMKKNKIVNKEFHWEYAIYGDVPDWNYTTTCGPGYDAVAGKMSDYVCIANKTLLGTKRDIVGWERFENGDIPKGNITIALVTDVEAGDYYDGVPTLFGKKVERWATWNGNGFSNNLIAYFQMNATTGTNVVDILGDRNGTLTAVNNSVWVAGKIGNGVELGGAFNGYWINVSQSIGWNLTTTEATLVLWRKLKVDPPIANPETGFMEFGDSASTSHYPFTDDAIYINTFRTSRIDGIADTTDRTEWSFIAVTMNTTDWTLYSNASILHSTTGLASTNLGGLDGWGDSQIITLTPLIMEGIIDEVGVWNITLTPAQITELYNNGDGLTWEAITVPTLNIVQSHPIIEFNTSNSTPSFSCNSSSSGGPIIDNATLLIYNNSNSLNFTETKDLSGTFNNTFWNSSFLLDGIYNWSCFARGDGNELEITGNRTITVDTTNPTLEIQSPFGDLANQSLPYEVNLTFNVSDVDLMTCFYNSTFNSTLTPVTCNQTTFVNVTQVDPQTIFVIVNDSVNNRNVSSTTFSPELLEIIQIYPNLSSLGATNVFTANVSVNGSNNFSAATLFYNNTEFPGTITFLGDNNFSVNRSITAPGGFVGRANISFFWFYDFDSGNRLNGTLDNTTVTQLILNDCGAGGILILNYTLRDEDSQDFIIPGNLTNTTVEIDVDVSNLGAGNNLNPILNFSGNYSNVNPAQVCLDAFDNVTTFRLDVTVRYDDATHVSEYHHIQNRSLNNQSIPINIDLFDLLSSRTQEFLITFKDITFLPLENALIDITRQYISEGVFKTVEIGKTDSEGQTIGSFVLNEPLYTLIVTEQGQPVATFENILPFCEDLIIGNCRINLNAFSTGIQTTDWRQTEDIFYSTNFSEANRRITTVFTTADGSSKTVSLNVTLFDRFGNNTVCSSQVTSSSGSLICNIPVSFGNATVLSSLFVDNVIVSVDSFSIKQDAEEIWGSNRMVLILVLMITFPFMFLSNRIAVVLAVIIGFITSAVLTLIDTTSIIGVGSSVIWLVVAGGVLIWRLSRR